MEEAGEADDIPLEAGGEGLAEGDGIEEEVAVEEAGDDEDEEVDEDLKDAVEGSFRLKRLLSQDDSGGSIKRRRTDEPEPEMQTKSRQLLTRWGLLNDFSVKHVLDNLSAEELEFLIDTRYVPSKVDQRKTPAEFIAGKVAEFQERKLPGGAYLDVVSLFKFRWKLSDADEKRLRTLTHKDLRYVVENWGEDSSLEDLISEASGHEPDEDKAEYAMPGAPGASTIGRYNRLEIIDGLADSAVFGDANLSFSLVLARHRHGLGHVGRVIATTFEEIETLKQRYQEIDQTIKELEDYDAEVYHGVDCTRIAIDERFKGMKGSLGAVYYNFPHSGAVGGFFDSHPMVNWRHENLMRLFFRALRHFVKPGGSVKVSSNKGAVGVRYSYIVGSAAQNEFVHVETMPFLEWALHRYGRSYGDRRDVHKRMDAKNNQSYSSQNASNDMVYCFRYEPSGNFIGKQTVRPPPTLKALKECKDGPFQKIPAVAGRHKLAEELHARFMKEVTGTHVG